MKSGLSPSNKLQIVAMLYLFCGGYSALHFCVGNMFLVTILFVWQFLVLWSSECKALMMKGTR
jgi:hypothetical protein